MANVLTRRVAFLHFPLVAFAAHGLFLRLCPFATLLPLLVGFGLDATVSIALSPGSFNRCSSLRLNPLSPELCKITSDVTTTTRRQKQHI